MADGRGEAEWLDAAPTEKLDLVVPIRDGPGPVRGGAPLGLFVDVEVLPDSESVDSSTIGAIVCEFAQIRVSLSDVGQLIVPFLEIDDDKEEIKIKHAMMKNHQGIIIYPTERPFPK